MWDMVSDSVASPEQLLPAELRSLVELMKSVGSFSGGNTELAAAVNVFSECSVEPKRLKQLMNCWREQLRELGVIFRSYRSNGHRLVEVRYTEPVTQVPQDSV